MTFDEILFQVCVCVYVYEYVWEECDDFQERTAEEQREAEALRNALGVCYLRFCQEGMR